MKPVFVEGERIFLRPVEPEDAPMVAACNNDPRVRLTFFTHTPVSVELTAARIRDYYKPGADYIPLAICPRETEQAIGVTAFHRVDLVSGAAIFSICISDPEQWGHGYAREATKLMLAYGFNVLNLHRIQLHVWTGNERAAQVYEDCGFVKEGCLREAMKHDGVYCDFWVMGILEEEWRA